MQQGEFYLLNVCFCVSMNEGKKGDAINRNYVVCVCGLIAIFFSIHISRAYHVQRRLRPGRVETRESVRQRGRYVGTKDGREPLTVTERGFMYLFSE